MKLKPLNDRVLVKRLESEEKTAGGLYIPDTAKEKPSKGEVVAVGPGQELIQELEEAGYGVKKIIYGTDSLETGVSELEVGVLYLQIE